MKTKINTAGEHFVELWNSVKRTKPGMYIGPSTGEMAGAILSHSDPIASFNNQCPTDDRGHGYWGVVETLVLSGIEK